MHCPTCESSNFSSFTFSTGGEISLCRACGFEKGHALLREGSVLKLHNIATDLNELWQSMLVRQKLGEFVGESNRWLELSPSYRDTDQPFDYTLTSKPARKSKSPETLEKIRLAKEGARKRARQYRVTTLKIFRSFGWQVNLPRPRYVGITQIEIGPLVEAEIGVTA